MVWFGWMVRTWKEWDWKIVDKEFWGRDVFLAEDTLFLLMFISEHSSQRRLSTARENNL